MSYPSNHELDLLDGRFELGDLLGRGGMAEVFRATDLHHGRQVAVKILHRDVVDSIGVERFRREIAVTSAFTHPHILGLLESGEATTRDGARVLFYVMPLIEGETLRDRLAREGHLSLRDAIRITREVLEALQYAHEHGVIHRDIKPGNILLSGGHAVVADFGIARPILRSVADGDTEPKLTVSGVSVGTPAYMSPEQALAGAPVDARSDLYAAGCVLYEMLTGRTPFDASTGQGVIARKMSGTFLPLSIMRPGLPPVLDNIATRALDPDPAERFASAAEFLAALDMVADASLSRSDVTVAAQRSASTSRLLRALLPAFAVLVLAAGGWLWAHSRAKSSARPAPEALDPSRVAVLPFENLSPDTNLAYVASGITADLIDELAQVHALTVVSKNGMAPLLAKSVGVDSLARVLRVGSVITGDVRPNAAGVSVTVRLVDGRTGQQLASRDTSGTLHDLLEVRSAVVEDAARFLRTRVGEQVRISTTQRRASNAQAWELVERVRALRLDQLDQWLQLPARDRAQRFADADTLAVRASRLDAKWPEPLVERAILSWDQALIEETTARTGGTGAAAGRDSARVLYRDAVQWCNQALARDPNDANALQFRGRARIALWQSARDTMSDSLRELAESDLRAALYRRPDLTLAWNDLSFLLTYSGDFAGAEDAGRHALGSDEFFSNAPEVLAQLQFNALGAEHTEDAVKWCAEGRSRYPESPLFFACELTTIGWTGNQPSDVARAWRVLDAAERRYTADILTSGWGARRLYVAAAAARAGLRDSALAIVARTRAGLPNNMPSPGIDLGEAHVRAILGQNDEAIRLLDRYLKSVPGWRRRVARVPWFKSLRADPRFIALTATR